MRKVNSIEIYDVLKDIMVSGMSFNGQKTILKNLRVLKPVFDEYAAAVKDAQERLKPEGFDAVSEKANAHNEAIRTGAEEGRLSPEELKEVSAAFNDFNTKLSAYIEEMNQEEADIQIAQMEEEDFEKLVSANDKKVDAGKLAMLYQHLCN